VLGRDDHHLGRLAQALGHAAEAAHLAREIAREGIGPHHHGTITGLNGRRLGVSRQGRPRGARQLLLAELPQTACDRADLVVARSDVDLSREIAGGKALDRLGEDLERTSDRQQDDRDRDRGHQDSGDQGRKDDLHRCRFGRRQDRRRATRRGVRIAFHQRTCHILDVLDGEVG